MSTVTVKSLSNLQQLVVTSSHAFVADEPEGVGQPSRLWEWGGGRGGEA